MKRTTIILLGLMLASASIAQTTNNLKVASVQVAPGQSVTLNVELENEATNLMGWQFDITLPEGLTLALKNNGRPIATLGNRFATTEHSISSSVLANGTYRFIATSLDGDAIPGTSGTLFSITLMANASLIPGTTLTGVVKNIEFNTQANNKLTLADVPIAITIPGGELQKCETPTISYANDKIMFDCDTEGVDYVYEIKDKDVKKGTSAEVTLTKTYIITVYATKDGYYKSDVVSASIQWKEGRPIYTGFISVKEDKKAYSDLNSDGNVDVGDIMAIINQMAGQ